MKSGQYKCNTCGNSETFIEDKIVVVSFIPDDEGYVKMKQRAVTVGICTSCKGTAESVQETRQRDKKKKRPYSTKSTNRYRTPDKKFFDGVKVDTDHVLDLATGQVWRTSKLFKVKRENNLLETA